MEKRIATSRQLRNEFRLYDWQKLVVLDIKYFANIKFSGDIEKGTFLLSHKNGKMKFSEKLYFETLTLQCQRIWSYIITIVLTSFTVQSNVHMI